MYVCIHLDILSLITEKRLDVKVGISSFFVLHWFQNCICGKVVQQLARKQLSKKVMNSKYKSFYAKCGRGVHF